ncbi:MAG: SDR family oxidoreductase [Omnitrophica WOR_2 bacterium]
MAGPIEDQVILITGSTDGLGKATALELASRGARVLLNGRDRQRGQAALDEIRKVSGNPSVELCLADLSSQRQVRLLAGEVLSRYNRLDALVNNAGVFMRKRQISEDGLEVTFAVNVLAPFLLTQLLLERMVRSSPARIINISSSTHWSAHIDWDNLQGERYYNGYDAYALSKLGDILITYALAMRLKSGRVTANCLDPGVLNTRMLREGWGSSTGADPKTGAEKVVFQVTDPDLEFTSGEYFQDHRPAESSGQSYDRQLQEQFWQVCEHLSSEGKGL